MSAEDKALVIGYINGHNHIINEKLIIAVLKYLAPPIIEHFL